MVLKHFYPHPASVFTVRQRCRWLSLLSPCWCSQSMTLYPCLVIVQALLNIPHLKMTEKLKVRVHDMQPKTRPTASWVSCVRPLSPPLCHSLCFFKAVIIVSHCVQTESCAFSSPHISPIHASITFCLPCCPPRANE